MTGSCVAVSRTYQIGDNMSRSSKFATSPCAVSVAVVGAVIGCSGAWGAGDSSAGESGNADEGLKISGYARAWASFNLQDQPDTPNYNDKWKAQMQRFSVAINADKKTGPVAWHATVRTDQEVLTSYEKHLQDQVRQNTPGGPGSNMLTQYRRTDLRELYGEGELGDRIFLR